MDHGLRAWLARYDWGHLWAALTTSRPVGPHSPIDMMKRVERASTKVEYNRPPLRSVPRYEV